jgi:hypothetical protein
MRVLIARLQADLSDQRASGRVCQGTLLSREQYLADIEQWGLDDVRLAPRGSMTHDQISLWTAAIGQPRHRH